MPQQKDASETEAVIASPTRDGALRVSCNGVRFDLRQLGTSLSISCVDGAMVIEPNTTQSVILRRREI